MYFLRNYLALMTSKEIIKSRSMSNIFSDILLRNILLETEKSVQRTPFILIFWVTKFIFEGQISNKNLVIYLFTYYFIIFQVLRNISDLYVHSGNISVS